ncbi:hypothetical protein [Acidisoma sp. 7E03]
MVLRHDNFIALFHQFDFRNGNRKRSRDVSREGFWRVSYAGAAGTGFGLLVFDTGMVIGTDAFGGNYDGEYANRPERGGLEFYVTGTATVDGMLLVQGGAPLRAGEQFTLRGFLKHGDSQTVLESDRGPVLVSMQKIRDFPTGT